MELQVIQNKIYEVRGQKVMLDFDLAELYGSETKRLKEAVRRNLKRFPSDFMFELTKEEFESLRSQIASSNKRGGTRDTIAAVNDLSEDTRKELDDIYLALSQLAEKQKHVNKQTERRPIGFAHYKENNKK